MFQRCNAVAAFEVEAGQWRAQRAVAPLVAEHGFVDFEEGVQQPALLEDGDTITIDAAERVITADVSDAEMAARRAAWTAPDEREPSGTLRKYAALVSSASEGAVTTKL